MAGYCIRPFLRSIMTRVQFIRRHQILFWLGISCSGITGTSLAFLQLGSSQLGSPLILYTLRVSTVLSGPDGPSALLWRRLSHCLVSVVWLGYFCTDIRPRLLHQYLHQCLVATLVVDACIPPTQHGPAGLPPVLV